MEPVAASQTPNTKVVLLKVGLSLALGAAVLIIPRPDNLPLEAHRLFALLVTVVALWVSEAIPIGVTALATGAGIIILNIQNPQQAWAPFANPAVMFVLMVIMFGVVLSEVGLANRVMYYLLKFAGTNVRRMSFFLAVGCTIASTVFHDATITVIMVFAFMPVFARMGFKPGAGHKLPRFFFILIPMASSAGGFGTLLGGGRNPLAVELLNRYSNGEITIGFLQYIVIQFPISLITAVATWAILWILMRPEEKELEGVEIEHPGPLRGRELGVLLVFAATFVLWFVGDATGWHVSIPAAFALLGFCGTGWVSFRTICDKFPWESWLVFGAGVTLGVAMLDSGAGKFLAEELLPLLDGRPTFVVYLGLGLFGVILSSMMSNSAAVALMLPIALPMGEAMGLAPEVVAMIAPMMTSFVMLVIGCPPTIIAYSAGYFSQGQFVKVAIPWCVILLVICVVCVQLYWPLIGFPG